MLAFLSNLPGVEGVQEPIKGKCCVMDSIRRVGSRHDGGHDVGL